MRSLILASSLVLAAIVPDVRPPIHEDATADQLIRDTMKASYNLELERARTQAHALQQRFPDHPAGFTLYAETYWWEAQTDPGNKAYENAFYNANEAALKRAEAVLDKKIYPRSEIMAYLASAHGSFARFQVTQKEAFFSAMRAGLRAHRWANDAFRADPTNVDLNLGVGSFNYFSGSLPAVIKPFAFLIGARGDKEKGLEQLRMVMAKGRYARTEARIIYYTAMREEHRNAEALAELDRLQEDSPDNFVYYGWVTDLFRRQGRNLDGADYFEHVFQKQTHRSLRMARYALLEKAVLENTQGRKDLVNSTISRLKATGGLDPIQTKRLAEIERTAARLK